MKKTVFLSFGLMFYSLMSMQPEDVTKPIEPEVTKEYLVGIFTTGLLPLYVNEAAANLRSPKIFLENFNKAEKIQNDALQKLENYLNAHDSTLIQFGQFPHIKDLVVGFFDDLKNAAKIENLANLAELQKILKRVEEARVGAESLQAQLKKLSLPTKRTTITPEKVNNARFVLAAFAKYLEETTKFFKQQLENHMQKIQKALKLQKLGERRAML